MQVSCLGPGTHSLPRNANSPTSSPATAPPNPNNWWHLRSQRKPDHHKSRLLPRAAPRPSTPDLAPCPKEPHQRRGQDPIPLPAHRGRAEHVHSDWKLLHLGHSPSVPAGGRPSARLRSRPGSSRASTRPARSPRTPACGLCTLSRVLCASSCHPASSLRGWKGIPSSKRTGRAWGTGEGAGGGEQRRRP